MIFGYNYEDVIYFSGFYFNVVDYDFSFYESIFLSKKGWIAFFIFKNCADL